MGMHRSSHKHALYNKNPKKFVAKANLSSAQKNLVLSGDMGKIAHAVLDEHLATHLKGEHFKSMEMILCCV